MAADFNKPTRDDEYVNVLPDIRDNQNALALMFNGVSVSNIPVNSVQFSGGVFNLWDGGAWIPQAISVSGGGTGANNASDARSNLGVSSTIEANDLYLKQASNLADLDDKSLARTELQVLGIANNLSDVSDAATSFDNIKQIASQAQAEAGTDNELMMTALRTSQAIAALSVSEQSFDDTSVASGDFTSGTIRARRIGDTVTVTGSVSHLSSANVSSASGYLPAEYRPANTTKVCYEVSGFPTGFRSMNVTSSGVIQLIYFDASLTPTNKTSSNEFTISYVVT